jgi:hypothetical protein
MKSNGRKTGTLWPGGGSRPRGDEVTRRGMRVGCVLGLVGLAVAAGVMLQHRFSTPRPTASGSAATAMAPDKPGVKYRATRATPTTSIAAATPVERQISPRTREWVERLRQPSAGGPLTTESAVMWDEVRTQVIASGSEAVPAIREFLSKKTGDDWDAGARRVLGYDSARLAMFDALSRIGGAEAEAALASTLTETLDPREIALLARDLEQMAPGQYRQAAVDAARQALSAAASDPAKVREVAPLFEVLNRFGGITAVNDLEEVAARWSYYATISLAQLPDGAGVSSLVRLAQGANSVSGPATDPAIRMLASLSSQREDARTAFLELVRNNRVGLSTWAQLAPILAGAQLQFAGGVFGGDTHLDHGAGAQRIHLNNGNQNFWVAMPAATVRAEQWEKQLVWLDQLSTVATAPAAQSAIQEAWKLILGRLSPLTAGVR